MDASPQLARRDRAGKTSGTADDQHLVVIVLGVIDLIAMTRGARMAPAMANPPTRTFRPCGFAIEKIAEIRAIGTVYTKTR